MKGFGCTCGANLGWGRTGEEEKKRGKSLFYSTFWDGAGAGAGVVCSLLQYDCPLGAVPQLVQEGAPCR